MDGSAPRTLTADREIEHGFRAAVLHEPGLFRCDVRPSADAVEIMLRPLGDGPWATHELGRGRWLVHAGETEIAVAVDVRLGDGRARVLAQATLRRR